MSESAEGRTDDPSDAHRLRRLAAGDAAEVAGVFQRSRATAMPWLPVLHDGTEDLAFFGAELGEGSSWGAFVDGTLVGFAIRHDDWLRHLYVDPRHQRRGIGSALVVRVIAESTDGLQLWAFARNAPAIAFYRRHGFEVAERTDGAGNEEREPDVRMTRR